MTSCFCRLLRSISIHVVYVHVVRWNRSLSSSELYDCVVEACLLRVIRDCDLGLSGAAKGHLREMPHNRLMQRGFARHRPAPTVPEYLRYHLSKVIKHREKTLTTIFESSRNLANLHRVSLGKEFGATASVA